MMRTPLVMAMAVLSVSAVNAQDARLMHIPAKDAPEYPVAEWDNPARDVDGPQRPRVGIAEGAEAVARAPDHATRYTAKEYNFPMGSLRVLHYEQHAGPVIHQITFETQLMILKGSATVGVAGETVQLNEGDAVSMPSGVLRNDNPDGDTVVATWVVPYSSENPKATVVRSADLPLRSLAQWMDGDTPITVTSAEDIANAPDHAGKFDLKRYAFDGNSIRHAILHKGGRTSHGTNGRDILIYITKGRMLRTEDGVEYEVVAGDAIREENQKTGWWDLLEDSEFLATDMPLDPSRPRFNVQRSPNADVGGGYAQ